MVNENTGTLNLEATTDGSPALLVEDGGTFTNNGTVTWSGGTIEMQGNARLENQAGAVFSGSGTITGDVQNAGAFNVGGSIGNITITGDYEQTPSGSLNVELEGATDFDVLTVGSSTLDGTLNVSLLSEFSPSIGESFPIVLGTTTGRFNNTNLPELAAGLSLDVLYGSVTLMVTEAVPGTESWVLLTGGSVVSSPAMDGDGTVYVGSDDGMFYAINPDGTLKWEFLTGGIVESSPAIGTDGTLYVGSDDFSLYAINPDGTLKWEFPTFLGLFSSPAIGTDGTLYVGSDDFNLYAINPDGTQKWAFLTEESVGSSPAISADGTVYVGSDDGTFYAINPDGTLKWEFPTGGMVESSPAIGADGTLYVGSDDFNLYAINPDGTLKWEFPAGNNVRSSPAVGPDGTIYVGSDDGMFYAINPDGTLKWAFLTGGTVNSSPAIGTDGTLYVGSWDMFLHAINPDGTLKWAFPTGSTVSSSPAIGTDGTLYVGSADGNLYAINGSSGGLSSDAAWPMFHHDLQHTGQASCPLALGHPSYCTDCGPCGVGVGDCDGNSQCQSGLSCVNDVGANYGFPANIDVCESVTSCPWPLGHPSYCTDCGPCGVGVGDCDGNSQCESGLSCVNDVGANYGFASNIDVCESVSGCSWPLGHPSYCTDCGPCGEGVGDCDGNAQCQSGLSCVNDVGANYGFADNIDVCESVSGCPFPVGHPSYCAECGPCGEGVGVTLPPKTSPS